MLSYCLKCKTRTATLETKQVTLSNGRAAEKGQCAACGMAKFKFVPCSKAGGDLQKILGKLPGFPLAKYKGEKHLPGYQYCGPGTRLGIRLDDNGYPRAGEQPLNRVDAACLQHDKAYRDDSDVRERQKADIDLIHDLNAIQKPTVGERVGKTLVKGAMKGKIAVGGSIALISPTKGHRRVLKDIGIHQLNS